jgi:hypothetical protein
MPIFLSIGHYKEPVQVRIPVRRFVTNCLFYGEEFLAQRPNYKLETIPFQLPVTTYSTYSQLSSMFRGRFLRLQTMERSMRW